MNALGFNGLLNYKANYQKGKASWDNQIDLLYGMVNNGDQGYRKTLDRVFLDTKYGHAIAAKWNVFVAVNLLSQFAPGYKYVKDAAGVEQSLLISDAFAPAFVTIAIGAEYKPVDYFKIRLSPFAPRFTLLGDNNGRFIAVDPLKPYGVEVGKNSRTELYALQILSEFDKPLAPNLNLKWRYLVFANYETLEWKLVDHRVDLDLVAKVTKFINVSMGGIFVYDYDQDAGPQYNESLSFGFLYTFQNFADKK